MHFELNENENTEYEKLLNATKAVLRRKFMAGIASIRKDKNLQNNDYSSTLRKQKKKHKNLKQKSKTNSVGR